MESTTDSPHEHYRIAGYLTTMSAFGALAAGAGALVRLRGKSLPDAYAVQDLVVGAVATFKFARLIAKDGVTTPIRAPFAEYEGNAGSGEVNESPRKEKSRHVVGELLTCPFCLAPWIATGYVAGLAVSPRLARAWAAVFGMVGGADVLQHVYGRVRTD